MESGTVEIVRHRWAIWVDCGRIGEFFGLDEKEKEKKKIKVESTVKKKKKKRETYVEVSILEAGPDTVASLDFERWEAISLRD